MRTVHAMGGVTKFMILIELEFPPVYELFRTNNVEC